MSAFISEPFLLSSYGLSKRLQKAKDAGEPPSSLYATHEKAPGSAEGHVTISVQGAGVHLLDLSNLHPVVSHTLGPSTTFSCPAVSRNTVEDGKNICTTYAVIESSPDINPEESSRTVWIWRESLSSSLDGTAQKKKSVVAPHAVSRLFILKDFPFSVIFLSSKGELAIMDAELNIQNLRDSPDDRVLLESFVFSRESCSFLPTRSIQPLDAIITLLVKIGSTTRVQVTALNERGELVEVGDFELKVNPEEISSISFSTSGCLSILACDGSWHSFQLESTDGTSVGVSQAAETIHLTSLSFLPPPTPSPLPRNCHNEISLLSLGSSHVLLAAVTEGPAPELVLLLWDLQYSVLLASHSLAVPATLSHSKDNRVRLDLVETNASQALLLLTPTIYSPSARSSILVVPYTVPATSTIAFAMGRASAGMKWLTQDGSSFNSSPSELDPTREKLLATMRSAMGENRPAKANAAFSEWMGQDKSRQPHLHPKFSYTFLKQLLDVVLQPSAVANVPYSSEVTRYLLGASAVTGAMVEGGLLGALRLRNDWGSIELALATVRDLSEADIVQTLQAVITHHRRDGTDPNAMQLDPAPTDICPLPKFLSLCVSCATSSAAMRLALREHLRDAEDIVCVLEVLNIWIHAWGTRDLVWLPMRNRVETKDGVEPNMNELEGGDLPPLAKILSFLQNLFDASFLTLLQHPPSHRVIANISAQFDAELVSIDEIGQLQGPLEPFAKAHAMRGSEASRTPVDWRIRRKKTQEQNAVGIGLYRLEELVI